MFCKTCGKEINDKAAVCVGCGVAVSGGSVGETGTAVTAGYILAVMMPLIGGIVGLYLLCTGKAGHGIGIMVLALMSAFFWFGFFSALG